MNFHKNIWIEKKINQSTSKNLAQELGLFLPVSDILVSKNILSSQSAEKFLYPKYQDLEVMKLFTGIDDAALLIKRSIEENKRIMIYGDYDVDGITSTVILYDYLSKSCDNVKYFVPNRHDDGYGLNREALDTIIDDFDVLITVDCGITSVSEVEYLLSRDKVIIITDHHEPKESVPRTLLVNPKLDMDSFQYYAGVGVVYRLLQELSKLDGITLDTDYLVFAALGTIADLMPLIEDNRTIVKLGLESMPELKNIGLKSLIEHSNLKLINITAGDIAFKIAPKINASGRLTSAMAAIELFLTKDVERADNIATELGILNEERKKIEIERLEDAKKQVDSNDACIIVKNKDWNDGVIGIVASRLTEFYRKPAIVFTQNGRILKGSGRSIGEFNLLEALDSTNEYISKYGGHQYAAGLSLEADQFENFKQSLNSHTKNFLKYEDRLIKLTYTSDIGSKMINRNFLDQINLLSPFGIGNSKPMFLIKNVQVDNTKLMGKSADHLKMHLNIDNRVVDGIMFNAKEEYKKVKKGDKIDIIATLDKNIFLGIEYINLYIKDFKKTNDNSVDINQIIAIVNNYHQIKNKENNIYINLILNNIKNTNKLGYADKIFNEKSLKNFIVENLPVRENLVRNYNLLLNKKEVNIQKFFLDLEKIRIDLLLIFSFLIFEELGFAVVSEKDNYFIIKMMDHNVNKKMNLNDSVIYRNINKIKEDWNEFR
ncbi:MAG: single-stranded-DNA-specific exonuclease RecJ [Clostridiales bacterium]|nr:single-stranded-DNA-specific exonuclease RecJ [Clostridiales bacterium]